jgi:hypothetical protein
MGILKNIRKANSNNTTRGFYFGAPEAEAENNDGSCLTDYFEDYLDILQELDHGRFIFCGRKGVGKSAIAKYIKDTSDKESESFAKILKINDFELEKFIQFSEKTGDKEKLIFEWLILVNIIKLIVSHNCGIYTKEYSKLNKFLNVNAGIVNIDCYQVTEMYKNTGGEVNFQVLKHVFGGIIKQYFQTKLDKAPFYKLILPLKQILKKILDYQVNKDLEFWLMFDDLDINFNVKNEHDNDKIMQLIRVTKDYNNDIFKNNKAKILIFLRDDIRNNLISKYPDSSKIFNSYEIMIEWYSQSYNAEQNEMQIPLRRLVNKRIAKNFEKNNIKYGTDPWNNLFEDGFEVYNYGHKKSFKYILDFTLYRPRDLITILNCISKENINYPIGIDSTRHILAKYIEINITELKNELKLHFCETEIGYLFSDIFPFVKQGSKKKMDLVNKIDTLNFCYDSEKVFEIIATYSLICFKDSKGKLFFNYRDNKELNTIDISTLELTLPKCIYHYYNKLFDF